MSKNPAAVALGRLGGFMAQHIRMPGFVDLIVTRGFAWEWLRAHGWDPLERGFGSMEYLVMHPTETFAPLTDETTRDSWLDTLARDLQKESC